MRRERWLGRRVESTGRVVRVARLAEGWPDLVVGDDITTHQRGQAGERDPREAGRVVGFGEALREPDRAPQGFQRRTWPPPGYRARCAMCV